MGSHQREPGSGGVDDRTAAQRRLDLLRYELGATGPQPQPDQEALPAPPEADGRLDPAGGRHRAAALPGRARLAGAALDQLPAGLRQAGAERGVTGHHVTVVALLVAALVCGGAWWVLSGRPEQRAVEPVVQAPGAPISSTDQTDASDPFGAAAEPDGAATTGPATASDTPPVPAPTTGAPAVVVDVAGRVRRPGLVTLPAGSRVADALRSAGGARPGIELATLNLARPLVDGEQILVGVRALPSPATGSVPGSVPPAVPTPGGVIPPGGAAPLVNLNTATLEQLDTLPGIGPVTGQAILDWRTANGSFTSVDELLEVDGIGDATLADLRDLVAV